MLRYNIHIFKLVEKLSIFKLLKNKEKMMQNEFEKSYKINVFNFKSI